MAAPFNQYITSDQYQWVLNLLNFDPDGTDTVGPQMVLDRATAEMESDLSKKYVVPIVNNDGTDYTNSPISSQNRILTLLMEKLRVLIGYDLNRNISLGGVTTEMFIKTHEDKYQEILKSFLDYRVPYGFLLQPFAQGAQDVVQGGALSKADNEMNPFDGIEPSSLRLGVLWP
jgi:hypothetical protein